MAIVHRHLFSEPCNDDCRRVANGTATPLNRWERLRLLDSRMKMAQATANQPAFLKALAEYRELKRQT